MDKIRIFQIEFTPLWPVPHGLIIAASTEEEAFNIAISELENAGIDTSEGVEINEIIIEMPTVLFFESGNY